MAVKVAERWFVWAGMALLGAVALAGLVVAVYAAWLFYDLPDASELADYRPPTATRAEWPRLMRRWQFGPTGFRPVASMPCQFRFYGGLLLMGLLVYLTPELVYSVMDPAQVQSMEAMYDPE